MKQFFTLIMIVLFANSLNAQNNYEQLWKQVEQFEIDGLPKSALQIVNEIERKAKADKDDVQLIKTLLFKSKFALTLEEDAQLKIINNFKTEIANTKQPVKNVLQNMLAQLYWQYFQQNRWKFYNRTSVSEVLEDTNDGISSTSMPKTDFRTWSLDNLFTEIHNLFQQSLENGLILKQEQLSQFDAILHQQKDSRIYRPTVFDLLAHNALSFYKTSENSITKPAYQFKIDNETYLSSAKQFSQLEITSKDNMSLQLNALKIYQDLIQFHLKNKNLEALAAVNIERLLLVKQFGTFNNINTTLLKTLQTESNSNTSQIAALYDLEIANIYFEEGQNYTPKTNKKNRWKLKEALELCEAIISKFPKETVSKKAQNLLLKITQPQLNITTENYLPINKPSKVLVSYKNLTHLNFSIFKISESQLKKFNKLYRKDEQVQFIKKLKNKVANIKNNLPNENDYQNHSIEFGLPKLDNGIYLIHAKTNMLANTFAFATIQVTDFALVETTKPDTTTFQIIDRNNGNPITNAAVKLLYQKNYRGKTITKNLTTDSYGEVNLERKDYNLDNLRIEVSKNDQTAYFGEYYLYRKYRNNNEQKTTYKGFVFTDRSIYRPGQTTYFKAIAIKTDNGKSQVIPNETFYVVLKDINGTEIKKLELKSNEFGSVSGEFILPSSGLTGDYNLQFFSNEHNLNTYHYFSIEEYKRPKFKTEFNPITETFKLNDSITIKGNALAYAGSTITDAKVVYRVHRKVSYPSWFYWRRPSFYSEPQEITFGETKTNDKGEFEITFKALPDDSVDKNTLPIFNYEITADVTDINGETRSATTIVNVGYHVLTANISVASRLDKDEKNNTITLETKNLNGEFVPAKGTLKVYKLQAPETVLRPRPWPAPDYQSWTKTEFRKLFPHEAYKDESNVQNWKKGELVFETSFDTETSKEIALKKTKKWESGAYIIELETKDKFGQDVTAKAQTVLFSNKDKTLADKQLFSIKLDKKTYEIGDKAIVTLASAANDITVTFSVEKDKKITEKHIVKLDNNSKTFSIPVTQNDLGGFIIHYSYAAFNSSKTGSIPVSVPYPKTDLQIETTTFRNKLQPGTEETWSFKIKGPKGDKVSAELLASMYDASLDQFKTHDWYFKPIQEPNYHSEIRRNANRSFGQKGFKKFLPRLDYNSIKGQLYDDFNWFGLNIANRAQNVIIRGYSSIQKEESMDEVVVTAQGIKREKRALGYAAAPMMAEEADMEEQVELSDRSENDDAWNPKNSADKYGSDEKKQTDFSVVTIRKNLQETAFFYPNLQTDKDGNVTFSFTTPEALTQWKLQLLAHTKTLESAVTNLETVTQKELMVLPNVPRFFRQGDQITISTKIANLSNSDLSGQAKLELTDAITGKDVTNLLVTEVLEVTNKDASSNLSVQGFSVTKDNNTKVSWNLNIPDNIQAIQYKIIAKAGDFSDGEQNALLVLTNRMLVTETLPMWIKSNETRTFTLDKLASRASVNASKSLKHHKLTLEITSNPAWYAVQALPYLMEYPYDCNEQTFSRYYANALASHIAKSNPRIQEVFNQWRTSTGSATSLVSNLEKNQELKNILIQETPWLRDAQSETEQKRRIALLFDLNKMNNELQSASQKLKQNQTSSGAWPWFKGGRDNRYITQHIISGFGHLNKLNVLDLSSRAESRDLNQMITKAINYLDAEFVKEYKDITKYNKDVDLTKDHLSYTQLHYLYMRSFFKDVKTNNEVEKIQQYYLSQIQKYWLKRSLYAKGLMALVSHRMQDETTAKKILKSLKENSITSEELGMYWKDNTASWYWYQAPIETQALMIEAFSEIDSDTETIDNLKIWLLKNKQTNRWKTTKATTEAVYALLLQGSDWLSVNDAVDVLVGNKAIPQEKLNNTKVEAGTGYYKTSWTNNEVKPELAKVTLTKKGKGIAWGSLYWQYFEDLDKITSAETPLKLNKKLYLKTNTDKGEQISEITPKTKLEVGNLVRVRIELRSDRDMEFIHMKDMRAAGFEPVNVLSQYKWQDGLGYYESTKDAATNFFFDYLPKGVYVFEYDLRVSNAGNMSNGITTIQSMYAPEFSSHSEGIRVAVGQ